MARWLLLSLFGGALVTACVLPDVEIDPSLGGEEVAIDPSLGAGGTDSVPPPAAPGSSGAAGASGDIDPSTIAPPGAGGSAMTDVNAGGAIGGSGGAAGEAGSGGAAGNAGNGAGGSAGTGGSPATPPNPQEVISECTNDLDRETACISYCDQYIEACGDFPQANTYTGVADCTAKCILAPWAVGDTTTGSNSICCRWLHATLAAQGLTSQNPHCFHAAEVPSLGETGGCAPGAGQ